jgi:hypothetical protein
MRDKLKDIEYFKAFRKAISDSINQRIEWLKIGKVNPVQLSWFKKGNLDYYIKAVVSSYSMGNALATIKDDYFSCLKYLNEGWIEQTVKVENNGVFLDQYYLYSYDEMLWMLSIGYLLDISVDDFKKIVEVIDRDKVKDFLFEFIISAKIKDRQSIKEESYRDYFGIPETFAKLREVIKETDKIKAEKLVKEFITKDWYKNHKDAGWYNNHKSKHNVYFGYWSFETAAVVKIMGLDDSSFKDCQYYPKDLL